MKLLDNLFKKDFIIENKMYVILREDLSYKYIQGSHVLAQFALEHYRTFKKWNNETIIYLSVFNGLALRDISAKISDIILEEFWKANRYDIYKFDEYRKYYSNVKYSIFHEPDLESTLPTAIAIYNTNSISNLVKDLSLASR